MKNCKDKIRISAKQRLGNSDQQLERAMDALRCPEPETKTSHIVRRGERRRAIALRSTVTAKNRMFYY